MQYAPVSGLREGISFEITAPKSAALVAVGCHDHALARGMSILVGSIVGNYEFSLYILKCV